jgi:hypothetical protein
VDKNKIEAYVTNKNEGSVYDSYGPSELNDQTVWEVWVDDDGLESRFVVETDADPIYFSEFQQLAKHAQDSFEALKFERDKISALLTSEREVRAQTEATNAHTRRMEMFRTRIAAVVFLGSAISLIAFMSSHGTRDAALWYLFGGLIISGSTMFFGIWRHRT